MPRKSTEAIVLHCTASPEGVYQDAAIIRKMHKAQGWSDIGYHWLIRLDGTIEQGCKPENSIGSGVKGFNNRTIHVVYVGGVTAKNKAKDTRTPSQVASMILLCKEILKRYKKAVIVGHRDLSPDGDGDGVIESHEFIKECPCFDAASWANSVGLPGGRYRNGKFELVGTKIKAPTGPATNPAPTGPANAKPAPKVAPTGHKAPANTKPGKATAPQQPQIPSLVTEGAIVGGGAGGAVVAIEGGVPWPFILIGLLAVVGIILIIGRAKYFRSTSKGKSK